MNTKTLILLASIAFLAFFLRFHLVNVFPTGLYWDEASSGYNGYSILKTGRDEYGELLPIYFRAFGEYKLPGLIYSMSLGIALFGINNFGLRFPSALAGVLTALATFFLVRRLEITHRLNSSQTIKMNNIPFLASFLVGIAPWHIHFSRAGFDATIALFLVVVGVWWWFVALSRRSIPILFLTLFSFILSLYTYNAERVFTPLMVFFLFLTSLKPLSFFPKKKLVIIFVICLLLSIPFLSFATSKQGMIRASSESFAGDVNVKPGNSVLKNIMEYSSVWAKSYVSHFSLEYLFFTGDLAGRHSVREMGMLYLWQLPFVFFGIWQILKSKKTTQSTFAWLLLGALPASLARPSPHALRSLIMIIPLMIIAAYGIFAFSRKLSKVSILVLVILASYGLFFYLHLYYIHYVKRTGPDWQEGYQDMVTSVKKHMGKADQVFVTNYWGFPYLYFLLYLPYDPSLYLAEGGTSEHFGKFHFVKSPYAVPSHSLYVAAGWESPSGKKLDDIHMINGDEVFRLWKN